MDVIKLKSSISNWINKYKYVWVILLIGILLMLMPEKPKEESSQIKEQTEQQTEISVETKLEDILRHLKGAGEVKVMLTVSKGEQIIYQTDSTYSNSENGSDTRTQTIVTNDSDRNETGLIHQKNPPVYLGAVVLSQGADDPVVKLAIVEAVSNATGLGADRISVLKMR